MYDLSANSIALYQANPMFQPVDFSNVPFKELAREISAFQKQSNPSPETDALRFYLYNHGFHMVRSKFGSMTTIPDDLAHFAQTHIAATSMIGKRILCHTIVSTICEMDYLSTQKDTYYATLANSYGEAFSDFMHHIHKTNQWRGFGKVESTCGEMTGGLVSGFAYSDWPYRKPWTRITGLSRQCVFGEISLENFADQSFSLAHWGGSILNKGHLYTICTDTLYHLLDVQDSGQIPQWISQNMNSPYVTKEIKDMHAILSKHFPQEMGGKLDSKRIQNSKAKRDKSNQQIQQWVQAAFNAGGTAGRTPTVGDGRAANAIDRANRTLLGL